MSATLKLSPTGAFTGGTDHAFTDVGIDVNNGSNYQDLTHSAYQTRPQLTLRTTPSKKLAGTAQVTKRKSFASLIMPKQKADGSHVNNVIRVEFEIDPETTDAEIEALGLYGGQIACGSILLDFRKYGQTKF